MKVKAYLMTIFPASVLNFLALAALFIYLSLMKVSTSVLALLTIAWIGVVGTYFVCDFLRKSKRYQHIQKLMNNLQQKNLIAEILQEPSDVTEKFYYQLMKSANRSMTEQLSEAAREKKAYKEYIEQWVHEMKTPIAAMELVLLNQRDAEYKATLLAELEQAKELVEQVLYHARSSQTEKDYLVKELVLSDVIHEAIQGSQRRLIQSNMKIIVASSSVKVCTDKKWLLFILRQILNNAVQYKKASDSLIEFFISESEETVALHIRDNGQGIPKKEIARIFDKGFTGTRGREALKATGFGLYLSKTLCEKLRLEISAESEENKFTDICLEFPKNHFLVR